MATVQATLGAQRVIGGADISGDAAAGPLTGSTIVTATARRIGVLALPSLSVGERQHNVALTAGFVP